MRYHPRIGFTYMPGAKLRVQGSNGGYLVRTNAAGFRADREFAPARTPGKFRVLLFGDSQTAGEGIANAQRYSDLLEKAVPGLEIYNYGLSGAGTDQQLLAYRENSAVASDLVVIALYVENVKRLPGRILRTRNQSGEEVFLAKPYFTVAQTGLVLRNVPVPKNSWTDATLPAELRPHTFTFGQEYSFFAKPTSKRAQLLRQIIPRGPIRQRLKAFVAQFRTFQPMPEYNTRQTPGWLLLREILATWIRECPSPVLVLLLPHDTALSGLSDPRRYQARFLELARDTGCQVYDPLPELRQLPAAERSELWSSAYGHYSAYGHEVLARLLRPKLQAFMDAPK
jgi:hypothetical protein